MLADMLSRTGLTLSALGAVLGFSRNTLSNWMRDDGRRISSPATALVGLAHRCLLAGRWDLVTMELDMPKLMDLTDQIEVVLAATQVVAAEDSGGDDRYSQATSALRLAREQMLLRDAELRRGAR